jgi:glutathione S-transferase
VIRLWGRLSSINVRKVVWAAQETGVAFERIDAGGDFGGVDTPEFRRLNPNAMIPVLLDDGLALWESNVIVRYLCARHVPPLYPQPLAARFDAERWMDWQQTTLNPAGRPAFVQLIRTPQARRDAAQVEASIAATEPLLALLDAHLATRAYLAGDTFTMADIPVGCEVHRWRALPIAQQPYRHLDRWYAELVRRPATHGVLNIALS